MIENTVYFQVDKFDSALAYRLGDVLREVRKKVPGLTQKKFAEEIGVDLKAYQKYERGCPSNEKETYNSYRRVSRMSMPRLLKILRFYKLHLVLISPKRCDGERFVVSEEEGHSVNEVLRAIRCTQKFDGKHKKVKCPNRKQFADKLWIPHETYDRYEKMGKSVPLDVLLLIVYKLGVVIEIF